MRELVPCSGPPPDQRQRRLQREQVSMQVADNPQRTCSIHGGHLDGPICLMVAIGVEQQARPAGPVEQRFHPFDDGAHACADAGDRRRRGPPASRDPARPPPAGPRGARHAEMSAGPVERFVCSSVGATICSARVRLQSVSCASRSPGAVNSDPAHGERHLDNALGPAADRNQIAVPERARHRQRLTIDERFVCRLPMGETTHCRLASRSSTH